MVTKDIVGAARRVRAIGAREEEDEVERETKLGARGLGSEVSGFYLLGDPKKQVPRIESRGEALHERAAANKARHLLGQRSWCRALEYVYTLGSWSRWQSKAEGMFTLRPGRADPWGGPEYRGYLDGQSPMQQLRQAPIVAIRAPQSPSLRIPGFEH